MQNVSPASVRTGRTSEACQRARLTVGSHGRVRAPAPHSFRDTDDDRRDEADGPGPVRAPGAVVYGQRGPPRVREPRGTAAVVRSPAGGARARCRDGDRIYGPGPRGAVPSGCRGRPDAGLARGAAPTGRRPPGPGSLV